FLFKYNPYVKTLSLPLTSLIISHFALSQKQHIFNSQKNCNKIFMPTPLHKNKEKSRGFNQSALVAQILSAYYNLPLQENNLIKIKSTQSQTTFNKQQRQKNIANAFAIKNPDLISNKTIFLIDDVFTTGSTMEECAKILKANGASKVFGIVIARENLS
nr:phosphoribosyltransferase family protein [Pseudobdellovibrionaceae bacterium]